MRNQSVGNAIYSQIVDMNKSTIIVRQCSARSEPGVWIFCHPSNGQENVTPLLTRNQARRVISALQKFVDAKL